MHRKRGFTLIEVLTVVVVISIIASIAIAVYNEQQKLSRDSKRKTDMVALETAFENYFRENGNYPLTCNLGTGALSSCTGSLVTSSYPSATSPQITQTTSLEDVQAFLPWLEDSFGDPKPVASNPFNRYVGQIMIGTYFVFSSDMVSISSTSQQGGFRFEDPDGSWFNCSYFLIGQNGRGNSAPRPHRFFVGFFSESEQAWQFYKNRDQPDELNAVSWYAGPGAGSRCDYKDISELKLG